MMFKPNLKIMLLGDSTVGKTCLSHRFNWDKYIGDTVHLTIGVDFKSCTVDLEPGVPATLQTWDAAGLERFRSLNRMHFRNTDGYLLVFDLQHHWSFEDIRDEWYPLLPEGSQCVLVGHKSDAEKREVSGEEAEKLAQELGMPYMEASAATGHNVEEVYKTLARQIYKEKLRKEQQLCEERQQREEASGASWCRLM